MTTKAGVWIDHQQAIVILISETGQQIKKFDSGIVGPSGGVRSGNKNRRTDFVAEDTRERKLVDQRKRVFTDVLAYIRGSDSLLILGPGEAKGEFKKHIAGKKIRGLAIELETTDRMTDPQLAAKVRAHFATASAVKPVAQSKTVPKKADKATSGKRTRSAGK